MRIIILERAYLALLGFIFALLFAVLVLTLWPYDPLQFNSFSTVEDEACPGDLVHTQVSYEIDPQNFDSVRELEVKSEWVAVSVPGVVFGYRQQIAPTVFSKDALEPGATSQESKVGRQVPETPGRWRLSATQTLVRKPILGLFPRSDVKNVVSEKDLTVLSPDDPECKGKGT